MPSKLIRHTVLLTEKLEKEFKKYQRDAGYSTQTQMYIRSVKKEMKKFYSNTSEDTTKLQENLSCVNDTIVKKFDLLNERIELIAMRINKEGLTSKMGCVMFDILNLLMKREADHSEIISKCKKYDGKTLDTALSLLQDVKMIGIKKNKK